MNLTSTPSEIAPVILEQPTQRIDTGARIYLSRLFVAGVATALVLGRSRWAESGSMVPDLMMLIGLTMATLSMAGRLWCSLFIAGRKNAVLVTQGPYALSRNPLYFFSLIGAVGVGLASGMITVALAVGFAFSFYYPTVIRREEAYLHQRHGASFETYVQTVPCFWPRWYRGLDAFPASVECHPRIFITHMASALWFPIACGVAHMVTVLLSQGRAWPIWFVLP